jgi:CBS domain-containing protein
MAGSRKVEVHVRRLTSTGAVVAGELEVYCPNQEKSVAVNHCKTCLKFVCSGADPKTGRVFVECKQLTADSAKSLRAARRAVLTRRPAAGSAPGDQTPVTAIMKQKVPCARRSLEPAGLRALFSGTDAEALPVVNEHGEPVGVLLRSLLVDGAAGKAGDLMTRLSFVLPESATISQAAALMALERAQHVPIVGNDGRVAGMVSWIEVLRWFAQSDGYVVPDRE